MNTKRIGAFLIDFIITAMIMNIPFRILVIYPTIKGNQPSDIIARTLISTLLAFSYLILRDLPKKGSIGKRLGDRLAKTEIAERAMNIWTFRLPYIAGFNQIRLEFVGIVLQVK